MSVNLPTRELRRTGQHIVNSKFSSAVHSVDAKMANRVVSGTCRGAESIPRYECMERISLYGFTN
jgi:hypothetical protein